MSEMALNRELIARRRLVEALVTMRAAHADGGWDPSRVDDFFAREQAIAHVIAELDGYEEAIGLRNRIE